jgi:hypothetical protein
MFYLWLVDEAAATRTPEEETAGSSARDNALPNCDSAIDAIGLFNKRSRLRSRSVCRFADS